MKASAEKRGKGVRKEGATPPAEHFHERDKEASTKTTLKKFPKPEHGFDTALTYEQELEYFKEEVQKWRVGTAKKLEQILNQSTTFNVSCYRVLKELFELLK